MVTMTHNRQLRCRDVVDRLGFTRNENLMGPRMMIASRGKQLFIYGDVLLSNRNRV